MTAKSCKISLRIGGAAVTIVLVVLAARGQSASGPASQTPKLAEQQFKNIKVLKGIPADQLIPAMQFIAASLGVECEFCHVHEGRGMAFDKDDKKQKVRIISTESAKSPVTHVTVAPPTRSRRRSSAPIYPRQKAPTKSPVKLNPPFRLLISFLPNTYPPQAGPTLFER